LPDGTSISSTVKQFIPAVGYFMNAKCILKMNSNEVLPENLIVSVRIQNLNRR
jgi:hypothetical protein